MFKSIPKHQIRKGMFIQELKGSWVNHPFWRKSFLLSDDKTYQQLIAAEIEGVIIDTSRGLDVELEDKSESKPIVSNLVAEQSVPESVSKHLEPVQQKQSFSQEREKAAKLLNESKRAVASMFEEARMGKAVNAADAIPLVEEIASSVLRNDSAFISLARLKNKDDYTYMHSVSVCALMIALGRELNLSEVDVKLAGLAGLLHDIGKITIPPDVLNKPGALSEQEFSIVKMHPEHGYEILLRAKNLSEMVLDVCLHHHEKIDGTGYPDKLKGDQISLFAKMGAICDVYDAITSNRPYKEGWNPGVSLQRMAKWGGHFDKTIFNAFVKSVGIYPVGSMVMMKSGRLGVVIDQSATSLLKPTVKVFFSTKSKLRIPVEIIDLSHSSAQDEILRHEDPVIWGIQDANDLWAN